MPQHCRGKLNSWRWFMSYAEGCEICISGVETPASETALNAGEFFAEEMMRNSPSDEVAAWHSGYTCFTSRSHLPCFCRKSRSRLYSLDPNCWAKPVSPNSARRACRPRSKLQLVHTDQKYRTRMPGALAKAATTRRRAACNECMWSINSSELTTMLCRNSPPE